MRGRQRPSSSSLPPVGSHVEIPNRRRSSWTDRQVSTRAGAGSLVCVKGVVARGQNRGKVGLVVRGRRHRWGRQLRLFRSRIRDRGYVGAGRRAVSERRGAVCEGRRALSGRIGYGQSAGIHVSQWPLHEAANEDAKLRWWDVISRCSPAAELRTPQTRRSC